MKKNLLVLLGILIVITGLFLFFRIFEKNAPIQNAINSFEECVEAGNPVMESYPRQCFTDGKTFVEEIGNELEKSDLIRIESPKPNQTITSPLIITGEARGTWYFEASFPVSLLDSEGNQVAEGSAQALGEWMTEDFVPFEAELTFTASGTESGTLILEKANPSGLPENADELRIPVRFEDSERRQVSVYYYNEEVDRDGNPNLSCDSRYVRPVQKEIPVTQTPIQDTIELLIQGNLTSSERQQGFTTEFPLEGFELEGANLENGLLTLEFSDPQNATSGGSCRVSLLRSQIEKTAQAFEEVDEVEIIPETLFQP